jgi:hypothetical protein
MDLQILKTLGVMAGVAGLVLGVLLIVLREVLRQTIFPKMTQKDAYRLLGSIVFVVWSIGISGLAVWYWTQPGPKASNSTLSTSGPYSPIVQGAGGDVSLQIGTGSK